MMKWGYFFGAVIVASYFLLQAGAPWYTVAGGALLVAHYNRRQSARSARS
jgi:hypothetical protein